MRIKVRGWNRNHGWREIFASPLVDASHSNGDDDVPNTGVNIETSDRGYDRPNGGRAVLNFRLDLTQPLNGEYMMSITLSKRDI